MNGAIKTKRLNDAQEAINNRLTCIDQSLEWIKAEVEKYRDLDRTNWAHAGDLGHVDDLLTEIYEFLTNKE